MNGGGREIVREVISEMIERETGTTNWANGLDPLMMRVENGAMKAFLQVQALAKKMNTGSFLETIRRALRIGRIFNGKMKSNLCMAGR